MLFIAMRYVEGRRPGGAAAREGPLDPERAVALVAQLAEALDAAHAHGLVHRDVKPSNALIAQRGRREHVYLADFGLTKHIATAGGTTASDQLVGTIDYVAPERIRGERADGRADLYSLGCVLFECLTGEVPFARDVRGGDDLRPPRGRPAAREQRRPGLPAPLDAVVSRALAKDPADRFQTGAELTAAARAALPAPATAAGSKARWPVPRRAVVAGVALIVLAGAAIVALGSRSAGRVTLRAISENAVGLIDPGSGRIRDQFPVGHGPTALTVGAGSIWALNSGDRSISRIDRARDQRWTIPVGDGPAGLAFADGSLWVTDRQDRTVSQISPDTNRVSGTLQGVANAPSGIAAGFGALWVASEVDQTVTRIDLRRGRVTRQDHARRKPDSGRDRRGSGVGRERGRRHGLPDRAADRTVVDTIDVGNGPIAIAAGEGAVWVANRQDGTVSRIDPATDVATTVPAGKEPSAIAAGDGAVWVADSGAATVSRIDPAGRRPVERIAVGGSPSAIAVSARSVLTAAVASPASHRGGTLTVETDPYAAKNVDPGD